MRIVASVLFVLLLTGCATSYGRIGMFGGVVSAKMEKDVHIVAVSGNSYTSLQRVQQMGLLKSAEITLENGYQYFLMVADDPKAKEAHEQGKLREYALAAGTSASSQVSTLKQQPARRLYHNGLSIPIGAKSGGSFVVVMLKAGHPKAKRAISAKRIVAELRPILVKEQKKSAQ